MSNYYSQPQQPPQPNYGPSANNLSFFPSTFTPGAAEAAPQQQGAGYGGYGGSAPQYGGGVSGRMGEQGGLRTGWLAAFSTEGYDGEPPLLEGNCASH